MFLNIIKDFSLKKILKKSFKSLENKQPANKVKKVGILIDETSFDKKNDLVKLLISNGFESQNLDILIFKEKINPSNINDYKTINYTQVSLTGTFTDPAIVTFISSNFDLLISYYNLENPFLMAITSLSKANFKVGFADIDKRCNDLMINTNIENATGFVTELFKYLKILKKI